MTPVPNPIRAVLWDFGGVFTTSPFDAFTRYEAETGLPKDFIRSLNSRNPHDNAWAKMERSDIDMDGFCALFESEAKAAGHALDARQVLALLSGEVRPEMVAALKKITPRYKTVCLTNNIRSGRGPGMASDKAKAAAIGEIMSLFDTVIESSKIGVRKPEPEFYRKACEALDVAPAEAVFLDDLGINLKPAKAMGMTTIKVTAPGQALRELEAVLGIPLA